MKPTTKQISFPPDLWDEIRDAAKQTDRTLNGVIIRAVRHGLAAYLRSEGIEAETGGPE